jgi:hypothetical protein
MAGPAVHPATAVAGVGGQQVFHQAAASLIIAVRIASSTASRPQPAPSERAATVARRSTSAAASAASAWQTPFPRPTRPGNAPQRAAPAGPRRLSRSPQRAACRPPVRADLLHLDRCQLASARLAALRAAPQPARPVTGTTRLGAPAVRLAALAVGGIDAASRKSPVSASRR